MTRNKLFTPILILILCLMPRVACAQVGQLRNDFAIGVNGGVAFDRITFDPTINQAYKPGISIGLTARYTCEKYFGAVCALQGEINVSQMGWKEIIETSADTYSRTLTYIQVPLLARLGFGRERRGLMGYLILGPQVGYCIGDKDKRGGEWSASTLNLRPNNVVEQYDLSIQRKFDYGITGGLGIEVSTGIGHFMAEGRYYFGLSDIFNNGKSDRFGRSAHGAIVAKITYLFDLIKTKNDKIK